MAKIKVRSISKNNFSLSSGFLILYDRETVIDSTQRKADYEEALKYINKTLILIDMKDDDTQADNDNNIKNIINETKTDEKPNLDSLFDNEQKDAINEFQNNNEKGEKNIKSKKRKVS